MTHPEPVHGAGGASAPPRPAPSPGRRRAAGILGVVASVGAIAVGAVSLPLLLVNGFTPGGAAIGLVLLALVVGAAGALPVICFVIAGVLERRWRWPVVGISAAGAWVALALAAGSQPVADWHWQLMRPDLEAAEASGECPDKAGLIGVHGCVDLRIAGRAYDFGGGFFGAELVVHLADDELAELRAAPPGIGIFVNHELGDGWYRVTEAW